MHQFENIPHPHCSLLFVTANPAKSQMFFPDVISLNSSEDENQHDASVLSDNDANR